MTLTGCLRRLPGALIVFGFVAALVVGGAPEIRMRVAEAQVPAPNKAVTLIAFQDTVALVATPELVSAATGAPTYCKQVALTPLSTNASAYIEVQTTSGAANTGYRLGAGQTIVLPVQGPLTGIWVRVVTAGDGYSAVAWTN